MKDDRLYLIHIAECLSRVQQYTATGKQVFLKETLVQDAVIRNLQILSESTQRLSSELKTKYGDVDWRGMAAFRNLLVHNYFGINLERVWQIIEQGVPTLQLKINAILAELGSAGGK